MVQSVNTNAASFNGVRELTGVNKFLAKREERISTGLKVSGPKDNAAIFAISQALRGEIAGSGAVKGALALGETTVNVAIQAGQEVGNLLTDLKRVAVQASQDGLDASSRQALQNEFNALRDQIGTVVNSASFNGVNLLSAGAQDLEVLSAEDGSTISVAAQDFSAGGLGLDGLTLDSAANASSAVAALSGAVDQAAQGLANLGSSAKRIESQGEFTTKLQDILKEGVGNLIDANLSEEAAGLQADRIKRQLGQTSLSIANAGPQNILALFAK